MLTSVTIQDPGSYSGNLNCFLLILFQHLWLVDSSLTAEFMVAICMLFEVCFLLLCPHIHNHKEPGGSTGYPSLCCGWNRFSDVNINGFPGITVKFNVLHTCSFENIWLVHNEFHMCPNICSLYALWSLTPLIPLFCLHIHHNTRGKWHYELVQLIFLWSLVFCVWKKSDWWHWQVCGRMKGYC